MNPMSAADLAVDVPSTAVLAWRRHVRSTTAGFTIVSKNATPSSGGTSPMMHGAASVSMQYSIASYILCTQQL